MSLEDFFKRIETQYKQQLPFVVYRKPNKTKVKALLQQNSDLHYVSDFSEKGFVFAPFDDMDKSIIMLSDNSDEVAIESYDVISNTEFKLNGSEATVETKRQHIALVKKGVEAIEKGAFKKVVLSRKEEVAIEEENPINIFKKLLVKYASAFVYCWYHPKEGMWLGATPETLVKIEGHRFSIMALAGTQVYDGTLNVEWQDKEIQEQKYVTDFVVDSLKPSAESIKVSDTHTVKAGSLLHLKTMISAQLKPEANLKDIITSIHPTPAVCGLPKNKAKDFILKNENYNRAFYTGFLGELNLKETKAPRSGKRNIENRAYNITKKSTQLYVNLRCMQLKEKEADRKSTRLNSSH